MLTISDLQGSARQRRVERTARVLFRGAALTSVVISLLIVFVLFRGAFNFLNLIEWDLSLLSDNGWFPRRERFDLRTILVGSLVMGAVSMLVAVPFGLGVAIYLSEYASPRVRRVLKPIVEVLAGIGEVHDLSDDRPPVVSPITFEGAELLVAGLVGFGLGLLVSANRD